MQFVAYRRGHVLDPAQRIVGGRSVDADFEIGARVLAAMWPLGGMSRTPPGSSRSGSTTRSHE